MVRRGGVQDFVVRFGLILLGSVPVASCHGSTGIIDLDPTIRYQTIHGWEATASGGEPDAMFFKDCVDAVLDEAVNDFGLNRLRLEVRSGSENNTDWWTKRFITREIGQKRWRSVRYATVNDNADPFDLNMGGFIFSELDYKVEHVILPAMRLMEARGEKLFVNLTYVAFTKQIRGGLEYIHDNPEEYAEFVLATVTHLDQKYGFVPDSWEVLLEPDKVPEWTGRLLGESLQKASSRLTAAGYEIPFIAPSDSCIREALRSFDSMHAIPGVVEQVFEYAYHRYCGAGEVHLAGIASRAKKAEISSAMLEHIGSGHEDLFEDLTVANVSAWQQFALFYSSKDRGAQYYVIDNHDPTDPMVVLSKRAGYLRQYFRYIRANAQRIGARSNTFGFDPVAFVNPNGSVIVVVEAKQGGQIVVRQLPPGKYRVSYTTKAKVGVERDEVAIAVGEDLSTSIPAAGVLTVYSTNYLPAIEGGSRTISHMPSPRRCRLAPEKP